MPPALVTRNLLELAALAGLLALQDYRPPAGQPAPLPAPAEPPLPEPLWPVKVWAADGLPGMAEMLPQLPFEAQPLGLSCELAVRAHTVPRVSPDIALFPKPAEPARPLLLNGHGDYHHLTYYLLRDVVEPLGADYTVVNFDAHDDARSAWANRGPDDGMDCGNWGRFALLKLPHLRRIVQPGRTLTYTDLASFLAPETLPAGRFDLIPAVPMTFFFDGKLDLSAFDGAARRDLLVPTAYHLTPRTFAEYPRSLADRIPTRAVYITVDLDVLRREDFDDLSWGNGKMSVEEIVASIEAMAREHVVIGADVTGFPPNARRTFSYPKCLAAYSRIAQALADALARGAAR